MLFSCEVASCVPVLETFLPVRALGEGWRDLTLEVTYDILTHNTSPPSPSEDGIPSCGIRMILCCRSQKLEHSGRVLDLDCYFCLLGKLISDTGSSCRHTLSFYRTHPNMEQRHVPMFSSCNYHTAACSGGQKALTFLLAWESQVLAV